MANLTEQRSSLWDMLKVSNWVLPLAMALSALALAVAMLEFDARFDTLRWHWTAVLRIDAAGVRQVFAVTTGAMMTITGVVFSVSVVALTLASNQFGPRVLRNYFGDTGNKVVLGLFIATFVYGLLVLASVDTRGEDFVPIWSMVVGLVLTVLAVGGLIYFIHNISNAIQADHVIALIGEELDSSINSMLTPCEADQNSAESACRQEWSRRRKELTAHAVGSRQSGYIQSVDYNGLAELAAEADCYFAVNRRAGHFVLEHSPLISCYSSKALPNEIVDKLFERIIFGRQRTPIQDIEFSVEQLVQVALRALSPGINDSLTAITCVDWLSAALGRMSHCIFPSYYFRDKDDSLRVAGNGFSFESAVNAVFDPLRQNASGNVMVTIRLLEALDQIIHIACRPGYCAILFRHAELIYQVATESLPNAADREAVSQRFESCKQIFADKDRGFTGKSR